MGRFKLSGEFIKSKEGVHRLQMMHWKKQDMHKENPISCIQRTFMPESNRMPEFLCNVFFNFFKKYIFLCNIVNTLNA